MGNALLLTTLAGLFTGLGGLLAVVRQLKERTIGMCMAVAAGVMLAIAAADILPRAIQFYNAAFLPFGTGLVVGSLLLMGMIVAALMEWCLPEEIVTKNAQTEQTQNLLRGSLVMAAALLLHNLPEGILTLFSSLSDQQMGARLTLAVALHNLPEGMVVAAPLYYATGSRKKAVSLALLSGLAEPIGAVAAYCLVGQFLTPGFLTGLMVLVAGIMIWIAVAQLVPSALLLLDAKTIAFGIAIGVLLMLLGIKVLS